MKKVYPESFRRGFAIPLIIFGGLIAILLAAWAPWVTNNFAKSRALSAVKPPCEEFDIRGTKYGYDFKTVFPADVKTIELKNSLDFGNTTTIYLNCPPTAQVPQETTYFVSFLGTLHKISSIDAKVISPEIQTITPDETANSNVITSSNGWYKYNGEHFSFEYPPDFKQCRYERDTSRNSESYCLDGASSPDIDIILTAEVYKKGDISPFLTYDELWENLQNKDYFINKSKTTIDGQKAIKYDNLPIKSSTNIHRIVWARKNDTIYNVSLNIFAKSVEERESIFSDKTSQFDQILSTFRFLEQP